MKNVVDSVLTIAPANTRGSVSASEESTIRPRNQTIKASGRFSSFAGMILPLCLGFYQILVVDEARAKDADKTAVIRPTNGNEGEKTAIARPTITATSINGSDEPGSLDGRVEVPRPSERALSYYRSGNALWILGRILGVLIPCAIAFSGVSARLRIIATRIGRFPIGEIIVYLVLYVVILSILDLPLDYYAGYVREHSYGLTRQTFAKWASDQSIGAAITVVVFALFGWVPFWLMRRSPHRWWLYAGLVAIPFYAATILVEPIWIAPLFNTFRPMRDKALETKILALASEAGIEGSRVFEVEKSVDTNKVNAYVTGIGATKRIVLWDTLLKRLDDREILFVMSHEMGHYVLHHMFYILAAISSGTFVILFLLDCSLKAIYRRCGGALGLRSPLDVAATPIIAALLTVFNLLGAPIWNVFSRSIEHEADRFAIEITRDNHAGATAFVKLQSENLGNPRPGPLYKFWRSSHPPIGERIDFCQDYRPWENGEPLVYKTYFRERSDK
jgi:Zn-dependent protease with chaperone function